MPFRITLRSLEPLASAGSLPGAFHVFVDRSNSPANVASALSWSDFTSGAAFLRPEGSPPSSCDSAGIRPTALAATSAVSMPSSV
jgi:hypothetical protein